MLSTSIRLLVIEDEPKTSAIIGTTLVEMGFEVFQALDGERGLALALKDKFDVLVVDIMLPKIDGLTLVRTLRVRGVTTPVIMLSARGDLEQRIEGLEVGADDYLPKPFAMSELVARIRSIIRRNQLMKSGRLELADLSFDPATKEVRRVGLRIELSTRESLLLECLFRAEGRVVSRRDIISAVWDYDFDPGTNLVEVYVRRLREKVDRDFPVTLIHTVRGLGYALRLPS